MAAHSAVPTVTSNLEATNFSGEQVCFEANFSNSGTTGFGPYLRAFTEIGLSLDSAQIFGSSVTLNSVGVFPASPGNQLIDPITGEIVMGEEGTELNIIQLPVGSVVTNGPDLNTQLCITIDLSAELSTPLDVGLQPVYEQGDTATGDNGSISGTLISSLVSPTVINFSYNDNASESERVPGSNFPISYTHNIDIANGKTVINPFLQDMLANDLQFTGTPTITGEITCNLDTSPSTSTPGGTLEVSCTEAAGTSSETDVSIGFSAYITDILNNSNCAVSPVTNNVTLDSEFPVGTSLAQLSSFATVTAKHLAIQQTLSSNTNVPGDVITVTDSIQLSDYASANNLVVTDILPDGLIFTSHTSMMVDGPVVITPNVTPNGDGTTTVTYDIHNVTGDLPVGTTITLQYTATIAQTFTATGDSILATDNLNTSSSAQYDLTGGAVSCSDISSASTSIEAITTNKSIVAPQPDYAPGDTITFRLSMTVPSGDTKNIVFEDFLPLPVFDVSTISTTFGTHVKLASTDTAGLTPTAISHNIATNALQITWPDLNTDSGKIIAVDVDVTIVDDPFADNLSLTNLFQGGSENSLAETSAVLGNVSLQVGAPDLSISVIGDAAGAVDAGDTITYELTIENLGGADAYDVTANVPTIAGFEAAALVTVTIDGNPTVAYTGTLAGGDFQLDNPLAEGSVVVVTYTVDLADTINPGQAIEPEANIVWSSGAGAAPYPVLAPDEIMTVDVTNAEVLVTVGAVSPNGSPGNIVVGDTVTYQVNVTLPEGTTPDLVLGINLPAGLEYVIASSAVNTTGFVGTVDTGPSVGTSGAVNTGQTVTVAFDAPSDTVVTSDNNDGNNSFVFTFDAKVNDVPANNGISATQTKTATADLTYSGIVGAGINTTVSSSFAEHNLAVTTAVSPSSSLQVGDTVTTTITLVNNGTAPAYDVVITSDVNSDLFETNTITEDTTTGGYSYSYSDPTVSYTLDSGALAAGETVTFSYNTIVKALVQTGSSFPVSASATADSQDGVVAGEREDTNSDSETAATANPDLASVTLISSSESWTSDAGTAVFAIGEVATYQVIATLPEGMTIVANDENLIEVTLPVGFEYVVGTGLIRGVFDVGLSAANGGLFSPTDTAATVTQDNNVIALDLGNIANTDKDGNDEQIIFTFDAIVLNTIDNYRTDSKIVTGQINYDNQSAMPQSGSANALSLIGSPSLALTNIASPDSVEGGDIVTYTLTATNNSGTNVVRGWEWLIEESLPARLSGAAITSATLSRGNVDIQGCGGFSGNDLTLDSSCLAASEQYLDAGESLTVIYTAMVDAAIGFEEEVITTADFSITTLPGDNGTADATPGAPDTDTGERTGSQVENTSEQAVNDLVVMSSEIITAGAPTLSLNTSLDNANIGDTVTLTATFGIPTGNTDNFTYSLDLPLGLTYNNDPIVITLPANDFTVENSPSTTPGAGTDPIVLDFGSVTNSSLTSQSVTIAIEVTVDNILANQQGVNLNTQAGLSYQGVSAPNPSDTAQITVIEPNLNIVQTITAGATGSDATDTISYQTVVTNTSVESTAFHIMLSDLMPPELLGAPDGSGSGNAFSNLVLTNTSGDIVLTGTSDLVSVSDLSQTTTNNAGDTLTLATIDMPASSSMTLTYDLVMVNNVNAGDSLTNTVSASYNSLASGSGRDGSTLNSDDDNDALLNNYNETDSRTVTVANAIAIQSILNPAHTNNDFTPGDTVVIDVRVDLIEGVVDNVVILNDLPASIEFVSSSLSVTSNISISGDASGTADGANQITIDLGSVTNIADADATNDFLILSLTGIVLDDVANIQGATLQNSVSATGGGESAGPSTLDLDIVEPSLTVSLDSNLSTVTLGDTVTFTFTASPTIGTSNAFETSLELVIPDGLTYVDGSFSGTGSLDDTDPTLLAVDLGTVVAVNGDKTFSFTATVDNDANIGDALQVDVQNGVYSSSAGVNINERDYSFSTNASVVSDDASFINANQDLVLSVDNNGNGYADPGDILDILVTLENDGSDLSAVIFTEAIPANTTYVVNSLTASSGTLDDTNDISVDVGPMTSGETVTLSFSVTVNDNLADGALISAQGSVDSELTISEPTDADGDDSNGDQANTLRTGEPQNSYSDLYVNQSWLLESDNDTDQAVSPGDVLELKYSIENTGTETLSTIQLIDTLPDGFTYVAASAFISGAGNIVNVIGSDIAADVGTLDAGQAELITIQVTIDDPFVNNNGSATDEVFTLQASHASDQTASELADSNGIAIDGYQALTISAVDGVVGSPQIILQETWILVNDLDGDGVVDLGDTVRFEIRAENIGSSAAQDIIVNQPIPTDTQYSAGSAVVSQGAISSTAPFEANLGNIAPGAQVIASFDVVIDNVNDGTVISGQATMSGSNIVNQVSDNNSDASDGENPTLFVVTGASQPGIVAGLALTASSDAMTTRSEFFQGETLDIQFAVNLPAGSFADTSLEIELPTGLSLESGSVQLKRLFDNGLSSAENPGNINNALSDTLVTVTPQTVGNTMSLAFGGIINSDNDSNDEQYVLSFTVLTDSLVPVSASNDYPINANFTYQNQLSQQSEIAANELILELINRYPVAGNDTYTIIEDASQATFTVRDNDNDSDNGQSLFVQAINSVSSGGTVTIASGGANIVYQPLANFFGTETVTYTISDGAGGIDTANVEFTVTPTPDDPTAVNDTATVNEDSSVIVNVMANDADVDGDTISVVSADATNGTVSINANGSLLYTPTANFNGPATITYTISDGNGAQDNASVNVNVVQVNDLPVVSGFASTVEEDAIVSINVLSGASDSDGDVLSVSNVSASDGAVSIAANGDLIYAPAADFNGTAIITFTIIDGQGGSVQGTVEVVISPVNDSPEVGVIFAEAESNQPVNLDVLAVSTDVDGDILSISSAQSQEGTVSINGDGTVTFTPNLDFEGIASIQVCVSDSEGAETCVIATVNINNANTAPVLEDKVFNLEEDSTLSLFLAGTDEQGDLLTYTLLSAPQGFLRGSLPNLTYTPPLDFTGEDSFTYQANDGQFDSNIATVVIDVGGENDAPLALDDVLIHQDLEAVEIDVLANDSDPDGDTLKILGVTSSIGGVTWTDTLVTYTPVAGFVGKAILEYSIADPSGLTANARVLISLDPEGSELLPVISVPDDVYIDATALFTKVDLGVASAVDRFGNPLPVSVVDGVTFFEPGINTSFWLAEDSEGRQSIASQLVRVRPLVSIEKDQTVLEGRSVEVGVHLNGTSENYPLEIPYTVSGTAVSNDHNLVDGVLIIESGSTGKIRFDTFTDDITEDNEQIIITLSDNINRGNKFTHVISLSEDNVNPEVALFAEQANDARVVVTQSGGIVKVSSDITHPNQDNVYEYQWTVNEPNVFDEDDNNATFSFDPSQLAAGVYQLSLQVVDADDITFDDVETIYIQVTAALASLSAGDADADGILDSQEGYEDSDRDGIPDYLDAIPECNVLPEEVEFVDGYLVEGDPGVCLRIGNFALVGKTGGAQVTGDDIATHDVLVADNEVTNIGGIFDFIAYGLPDEGQAYKIVMPQRRPIPENAVYRKFFADTNWFTFIEEGDNRLWSTAGEPGFCPPPGGDVWEPGLIEGYWCVQIEIVDGGPNDADGLANSTIVDPGGVGVIGVLNSLPEAVDDTADLQLNTSITILPLENDSDADGDTLFITSVNALFGAATFTETEVTYTPTQGFTGVDKITYGISDGNGGTDLALIIIEVASNRPPVAVDNQVSMDTGQSINIDVLNNDSDPDGGSLQVIEATAVLGSVTINTDNSLSYTPTNEFIGTDTITYLIRDNDGAVAEAMVTVTVNAAIVRIKNKSGGSAHFWWLMLLFITTAARMLESRRRTII